MTQGELEQIPLPFQRHMSELESRIMSDLIGRLKANTEITSTADWEINRLYQLGQSSDYIKQQIKIALDLGQKDIDKLFSETVEKNYIRNQDLYLKAGSAQLEFSKNKYLQDMISAVKLQTAENYKNITKSLGFAIRAPDGSMVQSPIKDFYQSTLDNAMMDIKSGAFDYNTVLKRTIQSMTASGLRTIDFDSGWSNRVDVAARRAVMTGFNQVQAKINEQVAKDLNTDSYEVSWHAGARPEHQLWQGGVYSHRDLVIVCGYGVVTGLCGANCYHSFNAFIQGISIRTYTDEQLAELNAAENTPVEHNGKQYTKYEALQKQRSMETLMRKQRQDIKLLKDGGASQEDIRAANSRYRSSMSQYSDFSKKMNLPQQKERVYQDGLKNVNHSNAKQSLVKSSAGDKIKVSNLSADKRADINKDERRIKQYKKESAILYDANGNKVFEKKGAAHSVGFTMEEVSKMKEGILTHNHPGGATLSDADIHMMHQSGLAEIRAVGRDCTYSMSHPQKWPDDIDSMKKIRSEYKDIQNEIFDKMQEEALKKYNSGDYTYKDYNIEYQDNIIKILAEKFGLEYRKEKID